MRQASNRIREIREVLRERFGAYYGIRACAERAGSRRATASSAIGQRVNLHVLVERVRAIADRPKAV